ncbi:hypothetical protein ACOI1C_12120 [Bacillus sp. DJP31]|uniref:hypothetical protein n=1 Tax=Bacillus sp. DJP31 TaxID=3409789 RepID=UPI003BB74D7F
MRIMQREDCIFLKHDYIGEDIFGKIKETIRSFGVLSKLEKLQILLLLMMKSEQSTTSIRAYELTKALQEYENRVDAHDVSDRVAINYRNEGKNRLKNLEKVTSYISYFENENTEFCIWHKPEEGCMAFPLYDSKLLNFFDDLYQSNLLVGDYMERLE